MAKIDDIDKDNSINEDKTLLLNKISFEALVGELTGTSLEKICKDFFKYGEKNRDNYE